MKQILLSVLSVLACASASAGGLVDARLPVQTLDEEKSIQKLMDYSAQLGGQNVIGYWAETDFMVFEDRTKGTLTICRLFDWGYHAKEELRRNVLSSSDNRWRGHGLKNSS